MADFKLTGGCHCGNVRYTITAPAVDTHHCHCSICRKVYGAIFVTLSIFPRSGFKFDKQQDLGTYSTSAKVHRHFCKKCGCPVTIDLDDNPDLKAQTMAWKQRRDEFMKKFYAKDPMTLKEAWQRFYFIGKMPDGSSPPKHVHKLRLDVPVDKRKKPA